MRLAARSLCLSLLAASVAHAQPAVKLGVDVLREQDFAPLAGKRVGLIVNPASVDRNRIPTIDVLRNAKNVNLVALAGPEHGIYGDEYAGDKVSDRVDPTTGLMVYTLYGKGAAGRTPSKKLLDAVDTLVIDLQDVGSRSYTYISSMKLVMQACAEQDKGLVILDRPNPLGGERVEGSMVADKKFESFVSFLQVPYLHGMTMGELAEMTRAQTLPDYKKLTVVKMSGWRRDMTWADTGLDWIMPSPHVPHVSSVAAYAATGIMGELYQVSNGVGYTLPFEVVGSPTVDGVALAAKLNKLWPDARGIYFRPMRFKPFYATNKGEPCQGVQVHIDPKTAPNLVEVNFRIIEALGGQQIMAASTRPATAPSTTQAGATQPATLPNTAGAIDIKTRRSMFDKVTGSDDAGDALLRGEDLAPVFARWRQQCEEFKRARAPYLLY